MRRSEKQITDAGQLQSILRSGQVCFLSMVDDGNPCVVPVHYGYAEEALYIHSAPEGRKIHILKKNPDVSFCIVADYELVKAETPCSWSTKYTSVIGTGKARILTNPEDKKQGLTVLMGQYTDGKFDFAGENLDGMVIIRVEVQEITGKSSS